MSSKMEYLVSYLGFREEKKSWDVAGVFVGHLFVYLLDYEYKYRKENFV